jgi:hypothetical protein
MKILSLAALFSAFVFTAAAQENIFLAHVLLIEKENGARKEAWLVAATKTQIRYRETELAADTIDARISDFRSIYIYEPREYATAMDLYQARKYKEAKEMFGSVKARYKPILPMENSPAALATFYEMECLRKLGDLDGLAAALQTFIKEPLTRETQLRQLDLYVLWDAVKTKSWDPLETLAKERAETPLPGDQRAQVAYCHGLALEGLNRPLEALLPYQTALTADAGASEEIARQAALRILAIFYADPEVKNAIKVWGTDNENKNSRGHSDLKEAAAVTKLFEMSLGAGTALPAEYKTFLKYLEKAEN